MQLSVIYGVQKGNVYKLEWFTFFYKKVVLCAWLCLKILKL